MAWFRFRNKYLFSPPPTKTLDKVINQTKFKKILEDQLDNFAEIFYSYKEECRGDYGPFFLSDIVAFKLILESQHSGKLETKTDINARKRRIIMERRLGVQL